MSIKQSTNKQIIKALIKILKANENNFDLITVEYLNSDKKPLIGLVDLLENLEKGEGKPIYGRLTIDFKLPIDLGGLK